MSFVATLNQRFRHLIHELAKFGITGGIAFVITLGLSNALHGVGGMKSRFWAYKKWVFLPPTAPPAEPPTGLPEAPRTAPEVPVAAANAVNNGHVRVHQHRPATDSAQAR